MLRFITIALLAAAVSSVQPKTTEIAGQYVEVRDCDVWTGPCFANAEGNLTGKNAAMVWNITEGSFGDVNLDGLTVIAVIQSSDTLGTNQSGPSKAVILVDRRATETQRKALVKLAQLQGGELTKNVLFVQAAAIKVDICCCEGKACAEIDAGVVKIKTRCLDDKHDKACGNEIAYYPPLIAGVKCIPAVADHRYSGDGLSSTWHEAERRGAYVGTFGAR